MFVIACIGYVISRLPSCSGEHSKARSPFCILWLCKYSLIPGMMNYNFMRPSDKIGTINAAEARWEAETWGPAICLEQVGSWHFIGLCLNIWRHSDNFCTTRLRLCIIPRLPTDNGNILLVWFAVLCMQLEHVPSSFLKHYVNLVGSQWVPVSCVVVLICMSTCHFTSPFYVVMMIFNGILADCSTCKVNVRGLRACILSCWDAFEIFSSWEIGNLRLVVPDHCRDLFLFKLATQSIWYFANLCFNLLAVMNVSC